MDLRTFSPDDADAVRAWTTVRNDVARYDAPWEHPLTERLTHGLLSHGWDGEPEVPYLGTLDGEAVAAGSYSVSEHDNHHLAWLTVEVRPDRRREGLGAQLLRRLEADVAALGRTSVGMSSWETETGVEAFGLAHGYERKAAGINRRQHLAEVDPAVVDALYAESARAAADYELVRWPALSPDGDLAALAVLTAGINDAPKEGLDIEDQVFDAERIRAYEQAQAGRGQTMYRMVARHRSTGELAGQTVVVVDRERPELAAQHDTSVLAAHRGHRLGALLKSGLLTWLREAEPQVESVDTWNAESNGFMIGVNEALGYRVVGRAFDLQKDLPGATA